MKRHQLLKMVIPKLLLSIAVLAIFPPLSCSTQADNCTSRLNIGDCAKHNRCLNGGTCVDGSKRLTCACAEAFFRNYCEQRNECVYPGTCTSFDTLSRDAKCKCREGYALHPLDSRRCEPVDKNLNENATLIFGTYGGGIEQFSLSRQTICKNSALTMVSRIQDHSQISNALDVIYRTNTMYWSDNRGDIYMASMRQGAAKTVVLNGSVSFAFISSLAIDWVYGHLYFSDDYKGTIGVVNLDGSMKKILFTTPVASTTAIVVDPLSGWIYWADSDARNIERAAMDGSQRKVIANTEPKTSLGLTLDMTQNRLYWTTWENSSSIHSMNVDGSDKKLVFQAMQPTFSRSYFMSITTFGDFVYWRDHSTKSIYRTNKCYGGEATAIYSTANHGDAFLTLQAYHVSKQPEGVNYCKNRIGGQCSHLCFRIPSAENHTVATTCACPDELTLSSDQRTCT